MRELKQQRREAEQKVAVMVGREEVQVLRDTHKVRLGWGGRKGGRGTKGKGIRQRERNERGGDEGGWERGREGKKGGSA